MKAFVCFAAIIILAGTIMAQEEVLCVCRCCYLGTCTTVHNASWNMRDCSQCTAQKCRQRVESSEFREKVGTVFRVLEEADSDLPTGKENAAERELMIAHRAAALKEHPIEVCEIIAVMEAVKCRAASGNLGPDGGASTPELGCSVSTDIASDCYDRNAPVVKFVTWFFLLLTFLGLIFGVSKNHIPAFQEFNQKNFDY